MARQKFPGWNQVLMAERRRFQPQLCDVDGKERRPKGWCDLKQKAMAMIVLAALFIASPVLAAGPSRLTEVAIATPTIISMTATIDLNYISTLTDTGRIYVEIKMTNRAFIQYRGEHDWVRITDSTKCLDWVNSGKSVKIDCSKLGVDNKISVNARIDPDTGIIWARRVLRYQPRIRH